MAMLYIAVEDRNTFSRQHFTFLSYQTTLTDYCAGGTVSVRNDILKTGLIAAFMALCCVMDAQVYSVQPGAPATPQAQSADQKLGWGSNIENARLAQAAELALQHGDHALAYDYARRAAEAAPSDPQLWFLLGYAARLNSRFQDSVDAYNRGLRLSPSSIEGLSGLAQTYHAMGRSAEAVRILTQVVANDPRRREDLMLLGDLALRSADYAGARDWLAKAEALRPDARSELLLAIAYQHMKQMEEATHYLDLARKRGPDSPDLARSMAGFYREAGNYADAIAALKSIRNPRPDVIAELAYTYQLDGKLDEAATVYAKAANGAPKDIALQLSAAQAEVATGDLSKAATFLERASSIDNNSYRLHAIRGGIAKNADRPQDAVQEFSVALAHVPAAPVEGPLYGIQLHMELMQTYKELGDDHSAQHELEAATSQISALGDQVSKGAPFLRLRALVNMEAGNLDAALQDVKNALAISAHDRDDLQLDGDILMKLGRTEDAIAVYSEILKSDARNRSALTSLGYASRAAGRDQDAENYFLRLAAATPSSYIPHLLLGDLYTSRKDFKKAEESYSKAFALDPKKPLVMAGGMNAAIEAHDLGRAGKWMGRVTNEMEHEPQVLREKERYLSFKGDYQSSADAGREAIKVLPKDRDVVVYLGYDLLHLGKYEELLSLTTQYIDVLPKEPDIPLLQGYVHKHFGQSEQARQDFTEALARDPEVVTAYVNRGYMLNDLHQAQEASDDFSSALKREPDNGEAHLGLAYASLDLHKPQRAVEEADRAERAMGDSRDIHVIRATAYGRQSLLMKAVGEYRAALKFTPDDGALHLGLGNTLFAERRFRDAIDELNVAARHSPEDPSVYALLARSYANLSDRPHTLSNVDLAEQHSLAVSANSNGSAPAQGDIYLATGEALSTLGDHTAAMERFRKALTVSDSDRVGVRLAIAHLMAEQGHSADAERQLALAQMESEAGDTAPPSGSQYIAAADVFRSMHDYELSQTYLQRAKAAGAPDAEVRIGLANNYLALGDTTRAHAELSAVRAVAENTPDYQYLLAEANVLRQQHQDAQALTSFAQASSAEGDDQTAEEAMLQAGANEGMRITPQVSVLSDISLEPIFEDSTVYVLDSKLDASYPVPSSDAALLPLPRSSLESHAISAYHLHLGRFPTTGGFFQVRNARGQISVPSTNSVVTRNTTDYVFNVGASPTVNIGNNVLTFNSGIQTTIRRDSESPVAMDQNLFRIFTYVSTSSFFNAVSVSGYILRESGPFTRSNQQSVATAASLDFRVGAPWGKTALVTGWGANDQQFSPVNYEAYYTSSYIGFERKIGERLNVKAVAEDVRAWRIVGSKWGNAQNLRPAATVAFAPNSKWDLRFSTAYSSSRSFHTYDAIQNGFSVSYARPFRRKFKDDAGAVVLEYPIRFSAGVQQEAFFNFAGGHNQQFRPYVRLSFF